MHTDRFLRNGWGALASIFLCLVILLIVSATFNFHAEMSYCYFDYTQEAWIYNNGTSLAGERSPFQSIPHTLWLSIVTVTSVGYGLQ